MWWPPPSFVFGEGHFRDASLPVPCPVATALTLDEVYEDVDVPREPPRPALRRVCEPDAEYAD